MGSKRKEEWAKMADIAREAGVSLMTVSRAFKTPAKVRKTTRDKIEALATKLGYIPNLVAGGLATGRSHTVAAIIPSLRNSNYATMIQGLQDGLAAKEYQLMLALGDTPETEAKAVKAFLGRRPDGVVLTGREHRPETVAFLKASGLPVVETWELEGPLIDMASGFSIFDAIHRMTTHLIDLGHRYIGFAGYSVPGIRRFEDRHLGFKAALRAAGLREDLVHQAEGLAGFAGGRQALEVLAERETRLSALVCATDVLAVGAILECYRRNWSVPGRFAVAGAGDYEIASEIPGGLTTIRTRGYDIGTSAADLIARRLDGDKIDRKIHDVGFELAVRGSTVPADKGM